MIIKSEYDLPCPTSTFHETIMSKCLEHSAKNPEGVATIDSENRANVVTFREIYDRAVALSQWLQDRGYKKGDILLLYMHNSTEMIITCLGAWSAGLIVTSASCEFTHYELRTRLLDTTPAIIVTTNELISNYQKAKEGLNVKDVLCLDAPEYSDNIHNLKDILNTPHSCGYNPVPIDMENDLAVIPYSSGTTGAPKGVMITHQNFAYMLQAYVRRYIGDAEKAGLKFCSSAKTTLSFVTFSHAMGMFAVYWCIYNGSTQVIMKNFIMKEFLQNIQDFKIRSVALVPDKVLALANSDLLSSYDLSSLAGIATGTAPLGESVKAKLLAKLPGIVFRQGFGMTEMVLTTHIAGPSAPVGSVGTLMPGVEMKVISADGTLCGPHQKGELWLRGPSRMRGYWRREKSITEELMDQDGFMRTGDIVYFDNDNNTFVCDRIKEVMKVRGKAVAPAEIEAVLLEHSLIREVCVVGVPDGTSGEELPRAFVICQGLEPDSIHHFLNERVASYKQLFGGIEFVTELPKTNTGKILRRKLKEEFMKRNNANG